MAIKTYYLLKRYTDTSEKNLPFYIENLTSNNRTVTLKAQYSDATNVECSTDNSTWTAVTVSSNNEYQFTAAANSKTYIRANATHWGSSGTASILSFSSPFNFNVGGNLMSLLYGSTFTGIETTFPDNSATYIFANMFYGSSTLQSAEKLALPVTTLDEYCYQSMFQGCTSLTTAPVLSATTLARGCYANMFNGCTSLTTAPVLPATTAAEYCYQSMFQGCTSLTTAPVLPVTTLAQGCYSSMFYGCTSLTAAPTLPANTLVNRCYYGMFQGCTSLSSVTVGATSWNTSYTTNWLSGVAATGTFTKPSGTNIPTGTNGVPSGWTVVNV